LGSGGRGGGIEKKKIWSCKGGEIKESEWFGDYMGWTASKRPTKQKPKVKKGKSMGHSTRGALGGDRGIQERK